MSIEPEKLYEKILPSIKSDFGHIGVEADLEDATWNIVNILEDVLIHRTITTVEELDALAVGSVVLDVEGDVCERTGGGWSGIIKERSMDSWLLTGAEAIDLPATVLYEPTV